MLSKFNPHQTDPNMNALIEKMPNVRVFYSKTGPAKYISHLDITRCMQRSLKRAGIPVWYTQGFNPHMYMAFALPLSLGYESVCEAMDLRLTETVDFEAMKQQLNEALPRNLRVLSVGSQEQKPQEIRFADYEVRICTKHPEVFSTAFQMFLEQPEILVEKRTKKGIKEIDIKPDMAIRDIKTEGDEVLLTLRTTAGQRNINPTLLTDAFLKEYADPVHLSVLRLALWNEEEQAFR